MSITVTIDAKLTNRSAIAAACSRTGAALLRQGDDLTNTEVRFEGWRYRTYILPSGEVRYDQDEEMKYTLGTPEYEAHFGKLGLFIQAYAIEVAREEAISRGLTVIGETVGPDGTIELEIDDSLAAASY